MTVSELYNLLEQLMSDEPEIEDFPVYIAGKTRQYQIADSFDGLRLGEFEDEELDDESFKRTGEYGRAELQSLEHLRGVWLEMSDDSQPLPRTLKRFRKAYPNPDQ